MSLLCPQLTVRRVRASLCAGALGQRQAPLSDFLGSCDLEQFFFLDYLGSSMTAETADTF
jgi:hypothetical protein